MCALSKFSDDTKLDRTVSLLENHRKAGVVRDRKTHLLGRDSVPLQVDGWSW